MIFTLTQALQLVGVAPCLFLILFLGALVPKNVQAIVPMLYFMALTCGFVLPLLELYPSLAGNIKVEGTLRIGDSTLMAFSFLLICQFMIGRLPSWPYWLVLAIPLIGGSSFIYASMLGSGDFCIFGQNCFDMDSIKTLYHLFSSLMIFLLLVYYASRVNSTLSADDVNKKHKYWLMIALIMLHLLVLAIDLAKVSGRMNPDNADFTSTIFRLTFIYLVMTSLFRVFYPNFATQVIELGTHRPAYNPQADLPHVEKIKSLLEVDGVYRQMRLNRAGMATMLGIAEHHLSRIINHHFSKNFNDLINGYRIEEAKRRLKNEAGQITVIGFEVGFNSIASFNRVFREKVGLSPTEYRNKTD